MPELLLTKDKESGRSSDQHSHLDLSFESLDDEFFILKTKTRKFLSTASNRKIDRETLGLDLTDFLNQFMIDSVRLGQTDDYNLFEDKDFDFSVLTGHPDFYFLDLLNQYYLKWSAREKRFKIEVTGKFFLSMSYYRCVKEGIFKGSKLAFF